MCSVVFDVLCCINLELIVVCYLRIVYVVDLCYLFYCLLIKYDVLLGGKFEDGLFWDDSYLYFGVGMDCCVYCECCVCICEEVQGQFIWEMVGCDDIICVVISKGLMLFSVGCVSCGVCVDICFSGVLFDK